MAGPPLTPAMVTMSRVELATVAVRLGHPPWTPLVRRVVGPVDPSAVAGDGCRAAAARLALRGLLQLGDAPGTVQLHPAAAAATYLLAGATTAVEALAPDGARQAMALAPEGVVLVDDRAQEDLLLGVLTCAVPVGDAVASLWEGGFAPDRVRVAAGDDVEVAVVERTADGVRVDVGATSVDCAGGEEAGAVVAAAVEAGGR